MDAFVEIIFKKGKTKNTITCKRPDGSATWMQGEPFMIIHDLTHYVVETQLGLQEAFFGLLARGWDITDFENKQKIRSTDIPMEGIRAEILVGLLLTERNDGQEMNDFNSVYGDSSGKFNLLVQPLEASVLNKLREGVDDLINKWRFMPMDRPLVLNFPA